MIDHAVILAAGRGTRVGALTRQRPKSMLPILGRPIIARVMDRLHDAGIRRFVVVIGERDQKMTGYLTSAWPPDTQVTFAIQSVATGTVDALQLAAPHIDGSFVLSSVDNLTSSAHVAALIHTFNSAPERLATLSLLPTTPENMRTSSSVSIDGQWITGITEKPDRPEGLYAAIMLYAFDQSLLTYLNRVPVSPRGEREIASAIQLGITDGRKVNYAVTQSRLHLTRERDLLAINRAFLEESRDTHILSEIPESVHLMPPICIDPNVSIGDSARIGPYVYLESGASVGAGAVLENTLVLNGGTVQPGDRCVGQIVAENVRITV